MTYNFDPEAWLERMLAALQSRFDRGEIDAEAFETGRADLERRYDEMVERLDGSYELPGSGDREAAGSANGGRDRGGSGQ